MKKKLYIIIGIILIVLAGLAVWYFGFSNGEEVKINEDAVKFKEEYEALNGKKSASGKVYQTLDIKEDSKIKYSNMDEVIEILENGTGLIYFGYPNCPWCRGMLPTLLETVDCSCLDNLYYMDMTDVRDTYEIKNGKPNKVKDGAKGYDKLLELLDEHLDEYTLQNGKKTVKVGEKRMYVPFIVAVKDGEVLDTYSTVTLDEGQTSYDPLTKKQKDELKNVFNDMIYEMSLTTTVCEEHC